MTEATINVPFAAKLETDSNCFGYVDHPSVSASCYAKEAKARNVLKANLIEQVNEALRTVKNYQTRALGTAEGVVFIVRYHVGSWQYSIVGPDRKFGGSCHGRQSFDETLADAKRHIESTFGGVVWECSL